MKNSLLSLAVIALLGFTGCIDSDEEGVDTVNSIETTDITVERGPVYGATVTDATGKIAQQKDGENVYTFIGEITYPITANGGWIDLDSDGMMGSYDIELAMELKSYSNVLTPITTYIADSSEEKREEKLEELLTLINNSSDSEITAQELLKVPSQTSQKAQMTINAVYAEMLENDSVTIDTDDILGRINEFENLDLPENLSAQDRAEMYEEYLVYSSDLVSEFAECKLDENDIIKYELPVLNIDSISKDSKSIVIINDYPIAAFNQLKSELDEYDGLKFYRASNNTTTCSSDFAGYSYCNEVSLNDFVDTNEYDSDNISIIGVYDIPNYVEDTSDASVNEIVGRTFYTIDTEYIEYGEAYYSMINITSLVPMEDSGSVDYYLNNGKWVVEEDYEEDDDGEVFSIEGDKLKIVYTDIYDGVNKVTLYLSIAEKTSSYWTMKLEYSDSDGYSDVMYDKWYLSPTAEMLNPSIIEIESYSTPSRAVARVNKIKRKIFGIFIK